MTMSSSLSSPSSISVGKESVSVSDSSGDGGRDQSGGIGAQLELNRYQTPPNSHIRLTCWLCGKLLKVESAKIVRAQGTFEKDSPHIRNILPKIVSL